MEQSSKVAGPLSRLAFVCRSAFMTMLAFVLMMLLHGRYGHMNIGAVKEGRLASRIRSYEFTKSMTDDWD